MASDASKYIPFLDESREAGQLEGTDVKVDTLEATDIAENAVTTSELADDAVETLNIKDANVTKAKLASGISAAQMIVFAGEYTWSAGGASCAETVTGALATDTVVASIQSAPAQSAYIASVAVTENTVTTTLSAANTGNDAVISYIVLRATS